MSDFSSHSHELQGELAGAILVEPVWRAFRREQMEQDQTWIMRCHDCYMIFMWCLCDFTWCWHFLKATNFPMFCCVHTFWGQNLYLKEKQKQLVETAWLASLLQRASPLHAGWIQGLESPSAACNNLENGNWWNCKCRILGQLAFNCSPLRFGRQFSERCLGNSHHSWGCWPPRRATGASGRPKLKRLLLSFDPNFDIFWSLILLELEKTTKIWVWSATRRYQRPKKRP